MCLLALASNFREFAKARAFIEDRCNALVITRKREMAECEAKGEKFDERDDVISFLLNQNDVCLCSCIKGPVVVRPILFSVFFSPPPHFSHVHTAATFAGGLHSQARRRPGADPPLRGLRYDLHRPSVRHLASAS